MPSEIPRNKKRGKKSVDCQKISRNQASGESGSKMAPKRLASTCTRGAAATDASSTPQFSAPRSVFRTKAQKGKRQKRKECRTASCAQLQNRIAIWFPGHEGHEIHADGWVVFFRQYGAHGFPLPCQQQCQAKAGKDRPAPPNLKIFRGRLKFLRDFRTNQAVAFGHPAPARNGVLRPLRMQPIHSDTWRTKPLHREPL